MILAAKVAGFIAAHAIWSVSEGTALMPMLASVSADGERRMVRLADPDAGASVAEGRQMLAQNAEDAVVACLVYDGRIPIRQQKVDAIIIEIRDYAYPGAEVIIAVPYTPATPGRFPLRKTQSFRVHKPKLLEWPESDELDINEVFQAFFEGVDEHEQGAKIWNANLDESL